VPDSKASAILLPDGAYSCILCKKTFGHQVKLAPNLEEMHRQAHIARFFVHLFSDDQIRGAFFEFCRREWTMSEFIRLSKTE